MEEEMKELVRRFTLEEAKAFIDQRKIDGQSSKEWTLSNDMIIDMKIECIGHFGGKILLNPVFQSSFNVFGLRNFTSNLGLILRELALLLDLLDDDSVNIVEAFKNQPVRLFVLENTVLADAEFAFIGHFMKNKFVWCADLATVDRPKQEEKRLKRCSMSASSR